MAIRSIISKLIIVLIVAFTTISVFWFFKTSGVKKHTLAMISSSKGMISASSVSVTGFPLKQKLTIEDLKVQLSPTSALPDSTASKIPGTLVSNNKYQIQIKTLEASSSVFSGDFVVSNIADVSLRDEAGVITSIQFNKAPVASFSFSGGAVSKFSYQDSGYKILDAGKNVLFENGNSLVTFESIAEGDKRRNKIKAEFKDVGALSFSNDMNATPSAPTAAPVANVNPDLSKVVDAAVTPTPTPASNEAPKAPAPVANNLVKKSFSLDVEYVVANSISAMPLPATTTTTSTTPTTTTTTTTVPAANDTLPINIAAGDNKVVESISVKNFEISSPLYKVNIYGEMKPTAKDATPIISLSAKIEKLDNILTYIKRSIVNIPSNNSANKIENINDITANNAAVVDTATTTSPSDSTNVPPAAQKPEADILAIIKDLSKKNPATNVDVAMFDFRQEPGKDLLINETPLQDIMNQIFVTDSKSTVFGAAAAIVVPNAAAAPIPAPAAINIPASAPAAPAAPVTTTTTTTTTPAAPPAPPAPAAAVPAPTKQ